TGNASCCRKNDIHQAHQERPFNFCAVTPPSLACCDPRLQLLSSQSFSSCGESYAAHWPLDTIHTATPRHQPRPVLPKTTKFSTATTIPVPSVRFHIRFYHALATIASFLCGCHLSLPANLIPF